MPKVTIRRKSTAIDMTAMCDVAFLLLTFFILTSKFKTEDPVPIDIPASTAKIKLPEVNVATISVSNKKVFFGVEGFPIRKRLLEAMGQKYGISFTRQELERFSTINSLGVPMAQLKQFINMNAAQRKVFQQPGIPTDTANNELFNWIREARIATKALNNKELRIAIKGDNQEEYPTIKQIIDVLQKQKVNKFSLITTLRSSES